MLLHQLREHLVLTRQALLQVLDLLFQLALGPIRRPAVERPSPVFKELLLPGIKQARLNPVLLTQIRDRLALQ